MPNDVHELSIKPRCWIDPDLCLARKQVIYMIRGVKKNLAIKAFEKVIFDAMASDAGQNEIVSIEEAERSQDTDSTGRKVITPVGAMVLVRMCEAGMIPTHGRLDEKDFDALREYAARYDEVVA